jgi:hypothetical protein
MLKKITRIAVLASLPLFFVACGGSSSESVESYAGHYKGTLAGSPGHEKNAGKLEFTISSTGKLTGTANVNIYPQILDGSIDSSGTMKIQMWSGGIGKYASMVMSGTVKADNTFTGTTYENYKPSVTGTFAGKKD